MKQKTLLLLATVIFCFAGFSAMAAPETEPNNTRAQANNLALGGSNTGAINVAGDEDWFKVTTTGDGKLNVTIDVSNSLNLRCYVYDNDGLILLNNTYTAGTITFSTDGLAAGTYYLKLVPYYDGQLPAYTISNTLTEPTESNDSEPNNTAAQAKVLGLNKSTTGHISYYYNNLRDTFDWYKVTTNADGRLRLTMKSGNAQNVYVYLFDNDATTLLDKGYTAGDATVVNTDGLAAGTYYIRVNTYYNDGFAPYTLSDSLFTPDESNDIEPNNIPSKALTMPLNGSVEGHIDYYYNNQRDTSDWYKVKTNADGRLRLTMKSGNAQNVYVYLFDNDATTLIAKGYTAGNAAVVNTDGLAAGTYYVRVNTYYNDGFAPYTLSDSLFTPDQANDPEPNNTKAQAVIFAPNSTITGHSNYYYNNLRDTFDWYSITIPKDGNININYTSNNGQNIYAILFDNNGTTVLNSAYTAGNSNYNVDGLQAGTYYLRLNTYYNTGYVPYTVTNTFTEYANPTDIEPNKYPSLARTLNANRITPGHVNFYYKNQRDSVDWYKINYTGSGNLTLNMSQEAHISNGELVNLYMQVYKDTLASPIASTYSSAATFKLDLTGLTQDYYYVRVFSYYNTQFASYSLENVFTQVNKAKIVFFDSSSNNTCGNDELTYKLSDSRAPYMVRLFKNGKQVDSTSTSAANVKFTGLNAGTYYATAFGDGATGDAFSKSASIQFLPPYPTGLNETNVTTVAATLNWNPLTCVSSYQLQYRVKGNATWTNMNSNDPSVSLSGLISDTLYYWQVRSVDNTDGQNLMSAYSSLDSFRTLAILPVTFINFDGVIQNGKALLSWSTANEINNKGFEVQKSTNGQTFTDIGFVAGHNNSSTVNSYAYTDVKVVSGANYYRLKQIDNNGNFDYSSVIKLDYSAFDWNILGNPVSGNSWIQLQLDKSSEVSIQIVSMTGNIIQTINKGKLSAGTYSIPINLTGKSAGLYVVRLMVDGQPFSKKIVK